MLDSDLTQGIVEDPTAPLLSFLFCLFCVDKKFESFALERIHALELTEIPHLCGRQSPHLHIRAPKKMRQPPKELPQIQVKEKLEGELSAELH